MSEVKVDKISPATGADIVTLGDSGDNFKIPSGGTLTIESGGTITNSGTASGLGGGKVLQIVQTRFDGVFSTNSTTYTALTGYSRTITPSATTSNIIIMGVLNLATNAETNHTYAQMYRDSTQINMGDQLGSSRDRGTWNQKLGTNMGSMEPNPILYYDTEISTTSSVTYSFQVKTASVTAYFNQDNTGTDSAMYLTTASTLICIEIGA